MESAVPISLYIDLEEGRSADLEVVAKAAISWAAAIKEIAYIIEPGCEFRIELASGTPGSLSLNSLIRKIRETPGVAADARTVAISVVVWFLSNFGSYAFTEIMDFLRGKDGNSELIKELSDEQVNVLAKRMSEHLTEKVALQNKQAIFQELEKDGAVKGVGISLTPGQRPATVIPRAEFSLAAGADIENLEVEKRTVTVRRTVTLVSPTLKGIARSWRFQEAGMPEFGATMKDSSFLKAISEGRISIPLKAGIEMDIDIKSKEDFEEGVWVTKERAVTRVHWPEIDRSDELPFSDSARREDGQ